MQDKFLALGLGEVTIIGFPEWYAVMGEHPNLYISKNYKGFLRYKGGGDKTFMVQRIGDSVD